MISGKEVFQEGHFQKLDFENLKAINKKLIKASTPQASTSFIDVSMPKCKNMHAPHTWPRKLKEHVARIWKNSNQSLKQNFQFVQS